MQNIHSNKIQYKRREGGGLPVWEWGIPIFSTSFKSFILLGARQGCWGIREKDNRKKWFKQIVFEGNIRLSKMKKITHKEKT
jgi:hypothetical protein